MKYFLHDTNSLNDEKISELFIQFGYEGIGLFYSILEKIAQQEKPIKTSVLKHQLKVGKRLEKCWSFMEEIGIISSNNGETFNIRLLSYSEKYQIKKEKTRERVSEYRERQAVAENITRYDGVSNAPKVKVYKGIVLNTGTNVPSGQDEYFELQKSFASKTMQEVGTDLKNFLEQFKPGFAEPYVDAWNFFADKYNLARVISITYKRKNKIRIRAKEPQFDFFAILTSAVKHKFYLGSGKEDEWKLTFDYIVDSESNYIKILERK